MNHAPHTRRPGAALLAFFLAVAGMQAAPKPPPVVLAGGVSGTADLASAENSDAFRAAGGGLYLHNNGWSALDDAQRKTVMALFQGRPLGIELGFLPSGPAWAGIWRKTYLPYAMQPLFVAANAFAGDNKPAPGQWRDYSAALRKAGVPATTRILPTFEFANFKPNIPTLAANKISNRRNFQEILEVAGGIVIDSPSGYFFSREQNYRDWVVDAIQWCRKHGQISVVIASPHIFKKRFPEDTRRFVDYLRREQALPDVWVCENYTGENPSTYPNRVGSEDEPAHVLGTARLLLTDFLGAPGPQP